MSAELPFFRFEPDGGRIGRIEWSNGDEEFWGHVQWDPLWPLRRPAKRHWTAVLADAFQKFREAIQALAPAMAAAEMLGEQILKAQERVCPGEDPAPPADP